MKTINIEQSGIFTSLSSSQRKALKETHNIKTLYDLLSLMGENTYSIKGFSKDNYLELRGSIESAFRTQESCYKNKYLNITYTATADCSEKMNIEVHVHNSYPIDKALTVGFDKEDKFGKKMYEESFEWTLAHNQKAYVWFAVDGIKKGELVLRFQKGEKLLETGIYDIICTVEVLHDDFAIKEDRPAPMAMEKEYSIDRKTEAIRFLERMNILTTEEATTIIDYLNGEIEHIDEE